MGDVLQVGCRAVYVPFAAGGETEQTARAERLERLGLAAWIAEAELTPERLGRGNRGCLFCRRQLHTG